MSVVINTNYAATLAADNLAASNTRLQHSLNRLSSGSKIVSPADDAGGLAVATKFAAAVSRQQACATNIADAVSYLETQDGALKVAGKILDRIGELKSLYLDPTKNSSDLANYDAEFSQLQAELTELSGETFNGRALFSDATLPVGTTGETDGATVDIGGIELFKVSTFAPFNDDFSNLDSWTTSSATVSGNTLFPNSGSVETKQSFSDALEIDFDLYLPGSYDSLYVSLGGESISSLTDGVNISKWAWHSVRIVFDGEGTASTYLDGSSSAADTQTGIGATSGQLELYNIGGGSAQIRDFSVIGIASDTNVQSVATATGLDDLVLSSVTNALEDVASFRATNGAQQSVLDFATEVLTTNKANLEAATSRITDVDVAAESTQLARYDILVQAGTSMLAQANQSAEIVLRLLS